MDNGKFVFLGMIIILVLFVSACSQLESPTLIPHSTDAASSIFISTDVDFVTTTISTLIPMAQEKHDVTKTFVQESGLSQIHEWRFQGGISGDVKWSKNVNTILIITAGKLTALDAKSYETKWQSVKILDSYNYANAFALDPAGNSIALFNGDGMQIYENGNLIKDLQKNNNPANCWRAIAYIGNVAWPIGREFIYASVEDDRYKSKETTELQVWDSLSLKCIDVISRIEHHPFLLEASSDGNYLAWTTGYISKGGTVGVTEIWDIKKRKNICTIKNQGLARLKPGTHLILTIDQESQNTLQYWDIVNCDKGTTLETNFIPTQMVFDYQGKILALFKDGLLSIVDVPSGKTIGTFFSSTYKDFYQFEPRVANMSFSPDGQYLLVGTSEYNRDDELYGVLSLFKIGLPLKN